MHAYSLMCKYVNILSLLPLSHKFTSICCPFYNTTIHHAFKPKLIMFTIVTVITSLPVFCHTVNYHHYTVYQIDNYRWILRWHQDLITHLGKFHIVCINSTYFRNLHRQDNFNTNLHSAGTWSKTFGHITLSMFSQLLIYTAEINETATVLFHRCIIIIIITFCTIKIL